jgi:hypothetical protein
MLENQSVFTLFLLSNAARPGWKRNRGVAKCAAHEPASNWYHVRFDLARRVRG